jgi:membrane-bound lytic murein transglycosylase D
MTYHSTRYRLLGLASTAALIGALMTAGANSQASTATPAGADRQQREATMAPAGGHFWDALALEPRDAWSRLRDTFDWQEAKSDERVQQWIEHYRANPENIAEITERARPWLAWITEQIEQRDLPGEIALVPFIESSFDPTARSHRGAAGLWQFMPGTADALGLGRNGAYDGRLDVVSSTEAALDYIEQQADDWYDGDVELSLAAYNAGAGTVNRARSTAAAQQRPDDYWSLDQLPAETLNYLPKLRAIASIIENPERYDVSLPEIEDTPAFAKVPLTRPLDLGEVANMAGVSREELVELNPGLINGSAHPNHTEVLLVPADREEELVASLESSESATGDATAGGEYVVQGGDSLSAIASQHGVTVAELRNLNGLAGDTIQQGQALEIPETDPSIAAR